jgi:hypothetical protein
LSAIAVYDEGENCSTSIKQRKAGNNMNRDVVRDGNCITSIGQAFIEFSIELGKVMNVYKSEEEIKNNYNWLKNIKEDNY